MKAVLSFSGGMDSTTLLYYLLSKGHIVRCLSIDYGQRHKKELEAARKITSNIGVTHTVLDLSNVATLLQGSSQTSSHVDVPEGHYTEESMKATVVPNRNMILLSLATAWAISTKSDYVAYAAHAGDHAIYPDCREEYASLLGKAIEICDWHKVKLIRPFIDKTKADIVKIGAELGVPYSLTWTCYKGLNKHCGKCGTCVERLEAFGLAGVKDPVQYEE